MTQALYERFLRGLAVSPGAPALRLANETVTYARAHETALLWAGSLLAADETPRVIGVLAGKGFESYVGILAGLYTGATVVPLHPDFPVVRTRRMLDLSGVAAIIVDAKGLSTLPDIYGDELDIPVFAPTADVDGEFRAITADPAHALTEPRPVQPTDTAYMLFTSGSTGRPKGVPISHGSTRHYFELLDRRYDFTASDIFSQTFDLNFDCAMFDLFCAWGAGASVQYIPPAAYRDIPAFLAEHKITVWFSTPSAIGLVRKMSGLDKDSMPGLRWSFFAGEALRMTDTEDWQRAASASTVENLYGPTELTVTVTDHRWDPAISPSQGINGLVPIGQIHEGHDYVLVTPDDGFSDVEGELCIAGPQMTAGYLDPEDNNGRFLEHDGKTWYRTGDRVRQLDGGVLVYLGRLDAQVQVQGWRVELAEIEHALRECAGVEDAVTVTRSVDGTTELVVFYTGEVTSPVVLAKQLRTILPVGMLPRQYQHVGEFPLNSNRKVDRPALATRANDMLAVAGSKR